MGASNFGGFICLLAWLLFLFFLIQCEVCFASIRSFGEISPGFQGSQMNWIDNNGLFLMSNNSKFGFGFVTTQDVTMFLLAVIHTSSLRVVWSANRAFPVANSDMFTFDEKGNAMLKKGSVVVWSTNSSDKGVSSLELQNSGNLVLRANNSDNEIVWESFSHPTDTLLSGQDFVEGMRLVSDLSNNNMSYFLEMKSGDMTLSAGFQSPQTYWSMAKENRKTVNKNGRAVYSATLDTNSWKFYDRSKVLLWQFIFSNVASENATWTAVLGDDGFVSFYNLQDSGAASTTRIPEDSCSTPEPCGSYFICYSGNKCQCPSVLSTNPSCQPGIVSPCDQSNGSIKLAYAGTGVKYFALEFLPSTSTTDLNGCKNSCMSNCSCRALFFERGTGNCFLLDDVGSFQNSNEESDFVSYIKVLNNGGIGDNNGGSRNVGMNSHIVAVIIVCTVFIIFGLVYLAFCYYRRKKKLPGTPHETSEDDNFLDGLTGTPIRYSYDDLQTATNNFSMKLGQGGFGSVYQGLLPDGTRVAVKKLEAVGQGKKEFRAEVSIMGSIHHVHLVRLKGYCAEGSHKLLAYEYMGNGSLDKWIFRKNKEDFLLDWNTRFNIALGTAKGLAYLHEDCDVKIIHCDIKPENVLLDDKFLAKVSDFGLAKLMTREQSHVFTTLRGTRGYLAPEWITNYAISEKSDVYSYGMVLLEIIGGRKNFDSTETSEKCHFPSYAFKMMEEGKLENILDSNLVIKNGDERVFTAIKVALWCIQEDMHLRPPMTRVVQMLEGLCDVPPPPTSSPLGSRLFSSFFKSISEGGTSSGPSDCNSDAYLSAMKLSGPR
ncbi:G-type lectin S-receptor-like serine/threonine-protein kinase SD2-5 [Cucumis melo var. makuwa]|uniref:Receptor-like serine/threonine-protein kinase n=1 Tax=Cucumis melo var. makuwa TaxID=1194695 RepID=A0A5A7T782_CUCMM|nr:G-type lectin S-receptor-like serine/threonine-protein kinase SD2-5 [Cucumis melo var. makuwa]